MFWFGELRAGRVPRLPGGGAAPVTAADAEFYLAAQIASAGASHRLSAVVIDVSPPSPERHTRDKAGEGR